MSEFDGIEDFDGWNAKLGELLGAAATAAEQNSLGPRLAVSERLTQFVISSMPSTPEILALDQIANNARSSLLRATIEERLTELAQRQGELAALTKKMSVVTAVANQSAASLRLEKANQVVKSLTESVKSLKDLKTTLKGDDDQQLASSLEKLIVSIQKTRSDIERKA